VDNNPHRHPSALYCLAISAAFFTFSLGSLNSLLVLYLTKGLHMDEHMAYGVFSAFNSLVFTLPLIGGYLAGKFGYKQAACVGVLFCAVAAFIMGIHSLNAFYWGLGLYAVGYGLNSPALFCMVGLIYGRHDHRRESGHTLFYIIMNLGFLLSSILGGYISLWFGYKYAYDLSGIMLIFSFLTIIVTLKVIRPHREHTMTPQVRFSNSAIVVVLSVLLVMAFPVISELIRHSSWVNSIMWFAVVVAIVVVLLLAYSQKDKLARYKLIAFLLLTITALCFWVTYMLEPSLLTLFISHNVDRNILGLKVPAASFYSLDSVFVISFGILLSLLWRAMAKRGRLPSIPFKFSTALVFMGSGSLLLVLGIGLLGHHADLVSPYWVVIAYVCFAVAELLIAPIGLSMVGKLAPSGREGILMGVFNLFVGFAAVISGYVGQVAAVPVNAARGTTNAIYFHGFLEVGAVTLAVGLLSFLMVPYLKKLIAY
jgi:POT family proton-dependent oligopeptide transporter